MGLLVSWLLSALSLIAITYIVPGFVVRGFFAALIAALVIGLVNATLGLFLKIVTFPLTLLTLGIFWLVINAIMILVAAALVPGFEVHGFLPAFLGAIVLSILNFLTRRLTAREAD